MTHLTSSMRSQRRRRSVMPQLLGAVTLGACVFFVLGFFVFVAGVKSIGAAPPSDLTGKVGVVALTGGSDRLERAVQLLADGHGERLLITGVHPDTTERDLFRRVDVPADLFSCCVDLDFDALDTVGNALATARWAEENDYDTLLLVTTDWHMPRSQLELANRIEGRRIVPVGVQTDEIAEGVWLSDRTLLGQLFREYLKYGAAWVRTVLPHDILEPLLDRLPDHVRGSASLREDLSEPPSRTHPSA